MFEHFLILPLFDLIPAWPPFRPADRRRWLNPLENVVLGTIGDRYYATVSFHWSSAIHLQIGITKMFPNFAYWVTHIPSRLIVILLLYFWVLKIVLVTRKNIIGNLLSTRTKDSPEYCSKLRDRRVPVMNTNMWIRMGNRLPVTQTFQILNRA